jgi:hypothetical protein
MNAKMFFAFVLSTLLFVSSAKAIVYTVRTASGPVTYSLEVPSSTLVGASIKPDEHVASSIKPLTASSAEVIAVGWAGGLKDREKFEPYPNSLTILGGGVPGGFYDATYVRPTSIQRINRPVPYYLVQMRGNVAGATQTLYAAVLDDGRVVRPVPTAYHPVRIHRENLAGSRGRKKSKPRVRVVEEAEDAREMGGAGLKEKWGLPGEKSSK